MSPVKDNPEEKSRQDALRLGSGQAGVTKAVPCAEYERRLTLYVWQELEPGDREAVERHIADCPCCASTVTGERALLEQLGTLEPAEPGEFFLAQCRRSLSRRLDRAEASARLWSRVRGVFSPAAWLTARPAWTIAVLVLAAFFSGRYFAPGVRSDAQSPASPAPEAGAPDLFANSSITGVRRLPGGAVAVRMTAEQPYVVQGSPEDSDIRGALLQALEGSGTPDPDARMESVDLLRGSRSDSIVRRALCQAVLRDPNPSVRLKAVDVLRGLENEPDVRQTLLTALEHDANPGVRVEAIGALRSFLENPSSEEWGRDSAVVRVLREREHKDPNEFVRMQSGAAIRQIAARNVQ